MKEIQAYIRPNMLEAVLRALHEHPDFPGVTVSHVRGFGKVSGRPAEGDAGFGTVEVSKLECMVDDGMAQKVADVIRVHAATGRPGDGKIAISTLNSVIRIRTGDSGTSALQ